MGWCTLSGNHCGMSFRAHSLTGLVPKNDGASPGILLLHSQPCTTEGYSRRPQSATLVPVKKEPRSPK
jgi:hypothetical protein